MRKLSLFQNKEKNYVDDYWQGDEEPFTGAYAGGAGAVFVSKTERDAASGLDMVYIAVPVRSAGQVIGVLAVGKIAAPPPAG